MAFSSRFWHPRPFWEGVHTPLHRAAPRKLGSMPGFHNWIICNQGKFRAGSSGESVVRIVICWHGRNVFEVDFMIKLLKKPAAGEFFWKITLILYCFGDSQAPPLNGSIPGHVMNFNKNCTHVHVTLLIPNPRPSVGTMQHVYNSIFDIRIVILRYARAGTEHTRHFSWWNKS